MEDKMEYVCKGNEVGAYENRNYKGTLRCASEEDAAAALAALQSGEYTDDQVADLQNGEWVY